MSEIKTKIRTYNDVIDLFGEEKAADMLSEALGWSTIDPKNDKKNIMERKPLLLDPYMTYEDEDGRLREIQYPVWIPMRPDDRCHAVRYDAHSD